MGRRRRCKELHSPTRINGPGQIMILDSREPPHTSVGVCTTRADMCVRGRGKDRQTLAAQRV